MHNHTLLALRVAGVLLLLVLGGACAPTPPAATPTSPAPTAVPPTAIPTVAPTSTRAPTSLPPTAIPTSAPVFTPPPPITGVGKPPDGKYLFVEIVYSTDGSGKLPQLMIDFPAYRFDIQTGTLSPFSTYDARKFQLLPTDWGFIGRTSWRRGAAGGGGAGTITVVPGMLVTFTVPIPLGTANADGMDQTRGAPGQLLAVAADGTAELTIDGERVVLAPGREWTRTAEFDLAVKTYNGRYKLTALVRNNGWLERAKLRTQP
ncbi:MAG: hypothetical protein HZB53_09090 [Chloroflexi bacterium]|nr:hypothetical protein [Chloroflexota bacterium]